MPAISRGRFISKAMPPRCFPELGGVVRRRGELVLHAFDATRSSHRDDGVLLRRHGIAWAGNLHSSVISAGLSLLLLLVQMLKDTCGAFARAARLLTLLSRLACLWLDPARPPIRYLDSGPLFGRLSTVSTHCRTSRLQSSSSAFGRLQRPQRWKCFVETAARALLRSSARDCPLSIRQVRLSKG